MNVFSHYRLLRITKILFLIPVAALVIFSDDFLTKGLCILFFVYTVFDLCFIDKMKNDYQHLYHSAYFDSLTGIPNRLSADSYVRKYFSDQNVCVAIADLDGLKEINDCFGHQEGDVLIRGFAELFYRCASHYGFAARNGGDEFLAIFEGKDSEVNMKKFRSELEAAVKKYNDSSSHSISYSIGDASVKEAGGSEIHKAISLADRKMYEKKRAKKNPETGRNCVGNEAKGEGRHKA